MSMFTSFQNGKNVEFDKATIQSKEVIIEGGRDFVAVVTLSCGKDEVSIHFDVLEDFFSFCEKHNIEIVDNREKEEAAK